MRIFPDSANFSPKKAMEKSVQNNQSANATGIAATEKYFAKNQRIALIFASFPSPANPETTGNMKVMSGVTMRNGIPIRLR